MDCLGGRLTGSASSSESNGEGLRRPREWGPAGTELKNGVSATVGSVCEFSWYYYISFDILNF